jgi:prepilin-type N-terminal cleavage/methylation domain-containing protein
MFPQHASERHCASGCLSRRILRSTTSRPGLLIPGTLAPGAPIGRAGLVASLALEKSVVSTQRSVVRVKGKRACPAVASREGGFTLLELLIVIGIIALLLVLIAPAFTTIKSGTDVTSAAYTITGALETARTYAKANNTYTWVGFAGSIGATITGQVQLVIVASKDGTDLGTSNPGTSDITAGVTPVGKLVKIDNIDIGNTGAPTSDGTEFESRPAVDDAYRVSSSGDTHYPFTAQQVTFNRWIRFSPRGEAVVKGGDTQIAHYAEVGVLPTHGTTLAATINPASGNLVAIQISGFGGNVRIYRR